MNPIRVLVADDEVAVREALTDLIDAESSMRVVATASDAAEAIRLALQHRPDVALLDVKMPAGGGVRAAREIRAGSPRTRILAISAYEDRSTVLEMVRAGAAGYLVKGAGAREVVEAIHRCLRGHGSLSAEVTADVLDELAGHLREQARETEEEATRERRIRKILQNGSHHILFQPIVDLGSGRVLGAEALSRFPVDPPRSPDVWFTEAASVGLGVQLELRAARLALERLDEIPGECSLSLNLSPETVASDEFRAIVDDAPGERLVIEVTEHAQVGDYEILGKPLSDLREMGIRLAVDDAGAGFSSPRHILAMSPEIIKLDMSLTRGIHRDRRRRALAAALISFAGELGTTVVAEGIETDEELRALRKLGVPCGQGFHLGRPAPLPIRARVPVLG